MVTPSQLIAAMAEVLGEPPVRVLQFDRVLSAAGLRSKRGRGRSAPSMTPRDSATLLIAAAANIQAAGSEGRIRDHLGLAATQRQLYREGWVEDFGSPGPGRWELRDRGLDRLVDLPEGHSFLDVLTTLIAMARDHEIRLDDLRESMPADRGKSLFTLEVVIRGRTPGAEVQLTDVYRRPFSETLQYRVAIPEAGGREWREVRDARYGSGDLRRGSTITGQTIVELGELLREGQ